MSRRVVISAVSAVGGIAVVASCTSSGAAPSGDHSQNGSGQDGEHNGTHSNGQNGNPNGSSNDGQTGTQDSSDPNAGIKTLTSQAPLPPQFQAPLPIPETLRPTHSSGDTDYYEIVQSQATAQILPGLKTPIWSYDGTFPGPTIVQNPNRTAVVTHKNALPVPTVVHLHGGTSSADSDGYPTDFILSAAANGTFPAIPAMPGMPAMSDPDAATTTLQRDYTYPPQPRAGTLWYHDHRMAFTGASVHRGLAGFHIAHDAEEQALPLPRGPRDVPLMIADRAFASDGSFIYPSVDPAMRDTAGVDKQYTNGVMGDVILVNGAAWPVMNVDTARYRLRILNASNARSYRLALHDPSQNAGFTQIGTDHGLLNTPVEQTTLTIAPAQRFDVVADFSRHKAGDQITLVNQLGSGSTAVVMRFTVTRATNDDSSVPATLSSSDTITPTTGMTRRTMKFHRGSSGEWLINGRTFDPSVSEADVPAGSTEVWTVTSDFHHPFHIHNATIRVISRDGTAPGPLDQGWKDTVFVNKDEKVEMAIRFADYKGRYVFHCHNLEHEDMGMMATFRIV